MRFSNQKTALTVIIQSAILCFLVPLFSSLPVKSVYEETQSLSFFKTKNVGYITRYKDMPDLNSLKVALKKWKPVNCPCKIFKVYQGYRIS